MLRVFSQAGKHFRVHLRDPRWRSKQAVSLRVFSQGFENFGYRRFDPLNINGLICHRTRFVYILNAHELGTYRQVNLAAT